MATTVSAKGWVGVPSELRKTYGLVPGRRVAFVDDGGALSIVPLADDPVAALVGEFAEPGGASWTAMHLEEHRRKRERDKRRLA